MRLFWKRKVQILRSYDISPLRHPLLVGKYLLWDPEFDNFTYDIANLNELQGWIAAALNVLSRDVSPYLEEITRDQALRRRLVMKRGWRLDRKRKPRFGRRVGWYAIARILKPALLIETGIHDGLGSSVLLRALERNGHEGFPGSLVSIDIDPKAGWLVPDDLKLWWRPVYGSTFEALEPSIKGSRVGMIIHDSEHTYECETFELTTALTHAASVIVLVSDNAHDSPALKDLCARIGIPYHFFRERPKRHFYPGAGIGLGVVGRSSRSTSDDQDQTVQGR